MTFVGAFHSSDTKIFILSAFGSVLLHSILFTLLTFLPDRSVEEEPTPTVQVKLISTPKESQATKSPVPKMLPPSQSVSPLPNPPSPATRNNVHSSPIPHIQASLNSTSAFSQRSLTPPQPTNRILKDTRAAKAMKARDMMKMILPTQQQQGTRSLPLQKRQAQYSNPTMLPSKTSNPKRKIERILPPPEPFSSPQRLTAHPPDSRGALITKPTLLNSSRPLYPRIARESGWEGTVMVRTLINTEGIPSQVEIQKSSGHAVLDQAAQEAIKSWQFQAAKDGNIPISKWVDIPIKFDLSR